MSEYKTINYGGGTVLQEENQKAINKALEKSMRRVGKSPVGARKIFNQPVDKIVYYAVSNYNLLEKLRNNPILKDLRKSLRGSDGERI